MKSKFHKIITGEASKKEKEEFFTELGQNPGSKMKFSEDFQVSVISRSYAGRTSSEHKDKKFAEFWSRTSRPGIRRTRILFYAQAAALILLLLYIGNIHISDFRKSESLTLVTPRGSISETSLDDGTHIWLNRSTEARVTKSGRKKVEIELKGEAYFDVPHIENREMIVKIGSYQIRDIGTVFNVKAFPETNEIIVSMFEGTADFETGRNELVREMKKGERLQMDLNTGKIMISRTDNLNGIAWKEGKFVFEQTPLSEILEEFEEWYDVKFIVENKEVLNHHFTSILKRKSTIEHLLYVLKLTSGFDYEIDIREDGSSLVRIF